MAQLRNGLIAQCVILNRVDSEKTKFEMMDDNKQQAEELVCDMSFNDGVYTITNDVTGIVVLGNTEEEAKEAFESAIDMLMEGLEKADADLTPEALELKEKLKPYMCD